MSQPLTAVKTYARPDAWGQPFWVFIHVSSLFMYERPENPTDREKKIARLFYRFILPALLPCEGCRQEYIKFMTPKIDYMLQSRMNIVLTLYFLHENVNARLGKKGITVEEFFDL